MKTYNFYDTSSLLLRANNLFLYPEENIVISDITLQELENIKQSRKSEEVKAAARKLTALLVENPGKFQVYFYHDSFGLEMNSDIHTFDLHNNDYKILATALAYDKYVHPDETCFVTNDLCLALTANLFFGEDSVMRVFPDEDDYTGYRIVSLQDEEMSQLYSNLNQNLFQCKINQYVLIKNTKDEVVDRLCWTGESYRPLHYDTFKSEAFGAIKPFKGDDFQMFAADSLSNNQITMIKGKAGSGKTTLALGYLMHKLEKGKINKIIIFCNTVAAKNSARLGYLPGSRDEKLLDSQIGNLLISKFGGRLPIEKMIEDESLILLPMSDIRGYDTSNMKAGIYISEAQNLDIELMRLALQRIGEDSICIIDGDCNTQVDDDSFAGHNNGMKRVSKVFSGCDFYGEIELPFIHRSRIARKADEM